MLWVAFSRRMCCSRVCSARTKPRRPSTSSVSPAIRPGIRRIRLLGAAEEPEGGPAEVEPVAERLALAEGDVGAALAGRPQDAERHRVGDDHQQRPVLLRRGAERLDVLDRAEEVRALQDHRSGLAVDRARPGPRGRSGRPRGRPRPPRSRSRGSRSRASRGCAGAPRARRRSGSARSLPSPGSRPRRPRRGPRRGPALETGSPVSSDIAVWNSNITCSPPCEISGW